MAEISVAVIDNAVVLCALVPEWRQFLARRPPHNPFQTPDWLLTWWSHYGNGKLHGFVLRDGPAVVGVVPAFLHDWQGRRQLTLIGTGISDLLEPVIAPETLDALAAHLRDSPGWDVCDWQDLNRDTPLGALGSLMPDTPCSRISLTGSFGEILAARPHGLRRNLRRYSSKVSRYGEEHFAVSRVNDKESLEALFRLHRARWQQAREWRAIDGNRVRGFLRDVAPLLGHAGMLRLFSLRIGGRTAAVIFGM